MTEEKWRTNYLLGKVYIAILTKNSYDLEMIHTFSVSNYHSIREEVVLDLRIPGTAPDLPRFRRSEAKPDIRLPSVVVLIGPNGSGKTTLLNALAATASIASSASPTPTEKNNPVKAFLPFFSPETKEKPTRFSVEFEADWLAPGETRKLFRYELVVGRDGSGAQNNSFRYEAMSYFPKGRPRRLFERRGPQEPIYVSSEFGLKPKDDRLKAVRVDASVVATFALFNVDLAKRIVDTMQRILWVSNIGYHGKWEHPTKMIVQILEDNPQMSAWVREDIKSSDLGIQDFNILQPYGEKQVFFNHHGIDTPVHLHYESSGTKRLFHLLPQLYFGLNCGTPIVLDEIDGDLHVDIAGEVLNWFRSPETNPHDAQLLVTSHNVGLLDDLEKEEVFITEKDGNGATRVHGAQDVRGLRRDARLYPKYRAGVLGGLPKIG